MNDIYRSVCDDVTRYCIGKGYCEGPGINNFVPHDAVAAFGMAKHLISASGFNHYLSVAPEGHIYGYFFEKMNCKTMEIFVPYPPVCTQVRDDLSCIKGKRVLIIEDDIISGKSLQLVVSELLLSNPSEISLFLGHSKGVQHLENVPKEISHTYHTEDIYSCYDFEGLEREFILFFSAKA